MSCCRACSSCGGIEIERLRAVERNLFVLVLLAAALGVAAPSIGQRLTGAVLPMLAVLMLCVSLTFDLTTLRRVLRRPAVQVVATLLVYGPMTLAATLLGGAGFAPALATGFVLLGALPTDVSSPLLVWVARGDVALATVLNAVNTALAPLVVPALVLWITGVELAVPVGVLMGELALTVLVPTAVGITIRTWRPKPVERIEPLLSAIASLSYLALLVAVLGPNAALIRSQPDTVAAVAAAGLALNLIGYGVARLAYPLLRSVEEQRAMLFTVSKKEFSIAAAIVVASGLDEAMALPAVVYAVIQMLTSPLVARRLART